MNANVQWTPLWLMRLLAQRERLPGGYADRFARASDVDYLHALYLGLLGRLPSVEEARPHLQALASGDLSRRQLALRFRRCPEYRTRLAGRVQGLWESVRRWPRPRAPLASLKVRAAYRLVLRRPVDKGALLHWRSCLGAEPGAVTRLIHALTHSEEYQSLIDAHPQPELLLIDSLHAERCRLVRRLPPASTIVDLGGSCPSDPRGTLVRMGYPHRFQKLIVVDLPPGKSFEQRAAKEMFDVVQTHLGPVHYVYRNMSELADIGLAPDSVDLFWMGQSVEHIEEAAFDPILKTILCCLKPGGSLCLDTPNRRVTELQFPSHLIHPDHKIEYRVTQMISKLEKAGFHVDETLGLGLASDCLRDGRYEPAVVLREASLNSRPDDSYIFYVRASKVF